MNRRSFLSSILAASAAPAIVRADSLMRMVSRETVILLPGVMSPRKIAVKILYSGVEIYNPNTALYFGVTVDEEGRITMPSDIGDRIALREVLALHGINVRRLLPGGTL